MPHFSKFLVLLITLSFIQMSYSQQLVTRNINVDGLNRNYLIYLPVKFNTSENLPVMMWFHGGGGDANGGLFEADFRSLANSRRFIAVYANAYPDVLEGCTCWGYDGDGESNGNYEIDLAYTSEVIDDVVVNYNANRNRIYAGGYSMGGGFVWDLACAKSDEIAAVAPVAASMFYWTLNSCDAAQPTAICHILGTSDFYAPYNGGWVPSAAEQHNYWVNKNEANTIPEIVNIGGGVTQYTWPASEGCHGVQHFRRQGGGHDVPSFATEKIWEFVSKYDINGILDCNQNTTCLGDFNTDGIINTFDLLEAISAYGFTDAGDMDSDGDTDILDILDLLSLYGTVCS